jgi:hypothetical protein
MTRPTLREHPCTLRHLIAALIGMALERRRKVGGRKRRPEVKTGRLFE